MINRIGTLRTVANNLASHLFMEGKTIIRKPSAIIPGAVATAGVVVTLETKDNNANLIVQKDDNEVQRATFNYKDTQNGYELVSAMSTYFHDDKDEKEVRQIHYLIEPESEKIYEHAINYANAPLSEEARTYIDNINSSIAQVSGYKSDKTDYDQQESHTYGKKSLKRDIPALLQILDIIAPDSEFTLRMKDKLKKDNKTSLVAFEASDTKKGNEIIRGFVSTDGDSVSYRINTEAMTLIGEQSSDRDLSRAYLKPEQPAAVQPEIKKEAAEKASGKKTKKQKVEPKKQTVKTEKQTNVTENPQTKSKEKAVKPKTATAAPVVEPIIITTGSKGHVYPAEYYINIIFETATNDSKPRSKKTDIYKETLAQAYLDGYSKPELENILLANGLLKFSDYCKKTYVNEGIELVKNGTIKQIPVKTVAVKIKELKNIKIDIEDENLKRCVKNMINDISKIENESVKEACVDKALSTLQNSVPENYETDLLLFIQEASEINDDFKLHYEIYEEFINDRNVKALKAQIELMINNVSDAKHHEERGEFLTKLYVTRDLKALEQLQKEVQSLLDGKPLQTKNKEFSSEPKQLPKLSIKALSGTNQKIVKRLLACKSPSDMSLTFNEIRNLLLDIGFVESNVKGTHHKFLPPFEILFNGKKQPFLTVATHGVKTTNPAQIDDLINVCRQYYGT